MTAKPELILHIGMGKTGTTALQEAFWANRDVLARAGITYPDIGVVAGAHHKITPFSPKGLAGNGWVYLKPEDWAPELAKSGARRILMSSELIAWAEPEVAARFCASLSAHFDLKICLYLRRQDNIMMAGYNQQIKAGNQSNPIATILERMIQTYDYARTIQTWEAAVGTANMIVRPYERQQFPGGDLIADFITGVLKIEMPSDFKPLPKDNSNPRFSHVALEYKRLINCISEDAAVSGFYTEALMEYSQAHDSGSSAVFSEQGLLAPQDRARILTHFSAQNAEIAQRFLGRETLFVESLAEDAAVAPPVRDADLKAVSDWLKQHHPAKGIALLAAAEAVRGHDRPAVKRAGLSLLRSFGRNVQGIRPARAVATAVPQRTGRRVIVHPGLPKTGTTSIQEAFFKNRAALLRDHGILYPGLDENHTQPILALFRADALNNIRFAGMTEAKLAAYRKQVRASLEKDIRAPGWHTLILSGEGICTLDEAGWKAFLGWLKELDLTWVEVVFGVRDGMDLVRSSVQQNLKSGMLLEDLYASPPFPRTRANLSPILRAVGRASISVWDFDVARKSEGGLLDHFCASLDLAPQVCTLIASTPVFQNESLSQTGVEALAARNRALRNPTGVNGIEHAHFLSLKGPKFTLPPEVAAKVEKAARQDRVWLEKTFPKPDARPAVQAKAPERPSAAAPAPRALKSRLISATGRLLAFAREGSSTPSAQPSVVHTAQEREIFVHFGTRKTGSSSIQQTLFDADATLRGAAYVHQKMANSSLLVRNGFLQPERLGRKIREPGDSGNVARLKEIAQGGLTEALNRSAARSNRLILSAETISDLNDAELAEFAQTLVPFAGKVRFVGYVRDPASFSRSVFQEVLKGNLPKDYSFAGLSAKKRVYHLIVDRLDARFGRENVMAFPFDRTLFPQGDVVRHFLQVTGLDPAGIDISRVNESLSMLGVKLLFIYRRLKTPQEDLSSPAAERMAFVAAIEGLRGPAFAFHPDIERQIRQTNRHIHDWAEVRLGQPLPETANETEGGIRQEADLVQLSAEEIARFADFAAGFGVTNLAANPGSEAVAEAMHRIRLAF